MNDRMPVIFARSVFQRIFNGINKHIGTSVTIAMAMLHFLRNTPREVIEATLLVKVSAKLVYHMVYPHQLKRTTTLQLQCVNT
jgi:hypothetical protein